MTSSFQGYVITTRKRLIDTFGSPTWDTLSPDGKVTTEWEILFSDGTLANIYDYKRDELGAPDLEEEYEWSVGGSSQRAMVRVCEALLMKAGLL